ncbi:hypothetical protein DVH26_21930 [Paenibacillus sp. H1-7]|nr:hypothetical protein DVH26_21930 [Paenibacillus sp. H1-7]
MRSQLFNNPSKQDYEQPKKYHENTFDHKQVWCESSIKGQFSDVLEAYFQPIISSFYVPCLSLSILRRGGMALT